MRLETALSKIDEEFVRGLADFVPSELFDIHAHFVTPAPNLAPYLENIKLGLEEYIQAMRRWLPTRKWHALVFGFPSKENDRKMINDWVAEEIRGGAGGGIFRGLVLTSPTDAPAEIDQRLTAGTFVGIKPYHFYAPQPDTSQAKIEDFAPEWMWELSAAHDGILMLHIMRDGAIGDTENLSTIRRLAGKYPRCRLVLAHIGRSFSYRAARRGLRHLKGLQNVWVDTSAVTESETFRTAIETLGADRILFGTDFPISELRGRCVATGAFFTWIYAEDSSVSGSANPGKMTLVGIESLLCLREAAEDCGLTSAEINAIFCSNALGLLQRPVRPG